VGKHSHAHIAWCAQVRAIPFKKPTGRAVIPYLDIDKSEQVRKLGLVCRSALLLNHSLSLSIEALLAVPDTQTAQGRRDRDLLLFLYNSGARAEEAARLLVAELFLNASYVTILGKGDKKASVPTVVNDRSRADRRTSHFE
jgi:integrase/recombinase XerD